MLKCIFLALEDFQEMMRSVHSVSERLRTRRGGGPNANLEPARDFLNWLLDENFILMGIASYRIGPDALPHRIPEGAFGVFRDPTLLPVVFPGLDEELERRLLPMQQDERIIEVDFCSHASAIYHVEPIDYLVVRHWDQNGRLEKSTLILGRFSQGSFAQRATHVPILRQKQAQIMKQSGAMPMSNAFRQIRALFNRLPRRELFYAPVEELQPFLNRIVQITGDDEIAIHHRIGAGYVALYLAFSKQRYSYELEENLRRTLSQRFGPITYAMSQDTESAQVVFFYFDLHRMGTQLAPGRSAAHL